MRSLSWDAMSVIAVRRATWVATFILGCTPAGGEPPAAAPAAIVLEGHVRFHQVEGGCWTIETDSASYQPVGGLPLRFRQDQLPVRATVTRVEGVSVCMVGRLVELVTIDSTEAD